MNNQIKESFAHVHAQETLKKNTRAFLSEQIQARSKKTMHHRARLMAVVASIAFIIIGFSGCFAYYTPVSVISVDVNPSVEIEINPFDRVISVVGYNEDGKNLAEDLKLRNMNYRNAIEALMENEAIKEYVNSKELLSITVAGQSDKKSEEILNYISDCTGKHRNVSCHSAEYGEDKAAHEAGLSVGKYRAFLELKELDPAVTPGDVQGMTMREIQNRIYSLSGEKTDAAPDKDSVSDGNCENKNRNRKKHDRNMHN